MCENISPNDCSSRMSPVQCPSRLSYPSCEDLGIPYVDFSSEDGVHGDDVIVSPPCMSHGGKNPKSIFSLHGMTYDIRDPNNPFSPYCRIPLPSPFGAYEYGFEPAFIRKRNERERERVRCVNEGYHRLRQHLPMDNKDKRISKVETLRCAISYIEHLQEMLNDLNDASELTKPEGVSPKKRKRKCSGDDVIVDAKRTRMLSSQDERTA